MGTIGLVNLSAEGSPPIGIMHSVIPIKRHPVLYRRPVCRAFEHRIHGLVCQTKDTLRRHAVIGRDHRARHKIRLHDNLPVLVQIQMLIAQIRFHIGTAHIVGPFLSGSDAV